MIRALFRLVADVREVFEVLLTGHTSREADVVVAAERICREAVAK